MRHRLNIIRNMKKNTEWELAEIFTDENLLGTDTRKHRDFDYMIEECIAGKINIPSPTVVLRRTRWAA